MPVTETEHEQRIERQREYRETSPAPEDERLALPGPMRYPDARRESVIESVCPRCGATCESAEVEYRCGCGQVHERMWW